MSLMINSCYLDTTILIEALLKTSRRRRKARSAIKEFKHSALPVYAIKEMGLGALDNAVWTYNRLIENRSLTKTYEVITKSIYYRSYRAGTAIEVLQAASEGITGADLSDARTFAQTDRMQADMHALALRRLIQNAWRDRRKLTSEVVDELTCFPDSGPYFDEELKIMRPATANCPPRVDCGYAKDLRMRPQDLQSLLHVIEGSDAREDVRRRKALHTLKNTPKREFDNKLCRGLGDAYFALNCPSNSTILTTNAKDHEPLAGALGKAVTEYKPT